MCQNNIMLQNGDQIKTFTVMKDEKGYLKPEQLHPIIEASPHPFNLCFLVAWNTGRRVSEIVKSNDVKNSSGIRKIDLDMLNNRIRFVTLKTRSKKPEYMWVGGIDFHLMKRLWELADGKKKTDPIFDFGRRVATMRFKRICEKIGILRIGSTTPHIHHLRHSAIMFMYAKGMKPEEIQKMTGHKDINNLLYYVKVMELENITEKFKKLWREESKWVKKLLG